MTMIKHEMKIIFTIFEILIFRRIIFYHVSSCEITSSGLFRGKEMTEKKILDGS